MRLLFVAAFLAFFSLTGCSVDARGRQQKKDRIVVLSTSAVKVLVAAGAKDKIAAISFHSARDPLIRAVFSQIPPSVGTASNPSIERIASAGGNVIITWNTRSVDLLRRHFGSSVFLFRVEGFDYLRKALREFARRFGDPQKAENAIAAMDEVLNLIKQRLKGCPTKRAVFCFSKPERVKGGRGIVHELLVMAGLSNIAGGFKKEHVTIGREGLVKADPEVVFIWDWAGYSAEDFCRYFPMITAVREGKVLKFPPHTPLWAPDCVLTALRMAMFAYPERFADVDYEAVADRFLRRVYGVSLNQVRKR